MTLHRFNILLAFALLLAGGTLVAIGGCADDWKQVVSGSVLVLVMMLALFSIVKPEDMEPLPCDRIVQQGDVYVGCARHRHHGGKCVPWIEASDTDEPASDAVCSRCGRMAPDLVDVEKLVCDASERFKRIREGRGARLTKVRRDGDHVWLERADSEES